MFKKISKFEIDEEIHKFENLSNKITRHSFKKMY